MSDLLRSITIKFCGLAIGLLITGCNNDSISCAHRINNQDDAIKFSIKHWIKISQDIAFKLDNKDELISVVKNPDFLNLSSPNRRLKSDKSVFGIIWTIDYTYNANQEYYFIKTKFDSCGILGEETFFIHGNQ